LPYLATPADIPPFFGSNAVDRIAKGSVALVAPLASSTGYESRPMLWQAIAKYRYRMPEGYIVVPGPTLDPPLLESALLGRMVLIQRGLATPPLTQNARQVIRCDLSQLSVRNVIVGPIAGGQSSMLDFFASIFRRKAAFVDGVFVWPVAIESSAAKRCATPS